LTTRISSSLSGSEHSSEHFQTFKEKLPSLRRVTVIVAVSDLKKGLNRLLDGFNRSAYNPSNPVRAV